MKKSIISIILCISLLFSLSPIALATSSIDTMNFSSTVVDAAKQYIQDIPIYITYVDNWDEKSIQSIKENASADINDFHINDVVNSRGTTAVTAKDGVNKLCVDKTNYKIYRITENNKNSTINRPEFASTINRVYELSCQGVTVNYVNFFFPSSAQKSANDGNANDPTYWENNCPPLCPAGGSNVYQGYKFLYLESSANVDTTPKVAGNIGGMNWTAIVAKITKLVVDTKVKNRVYGTLSIAYEALSTVFNGYIPPYSVTYSASSGYLKTWVTGDLYMRTILISDNLNRVSGYAYYDWGHLESFRAKTKVDAKWPVSVNPGGTYTYETNTHTYSTWRTATTPGYNGNATLYSDVIFLYENTIGYFTHVETVDVNSIIASII